MAWNLESMAGKAGDREVVEYLRGFDVIGCLETWLPTEEAPSVRDFVCIKAVSGKRRGARGRYPGGIAVYVKQELADQTAVLTARTNVIWIRIEIEPVCILGFVYNQPQDSPYSNQNLLEELQDDLTEFATGEGEAIFLLGDFNARTGRIDDRPTGGDEENFLPLPDFFVEGGEMEKRNSKDETVNTYGRWMVRFCLSSGLCILNGRATGDELGEYTCITPNGKSVVDYAMCPMDSMRHVRSLKIGETAESHHMPLELTLTGRMPSNEATREGTVGDESQGTRIPRYRWKQEKMGLVREKCLRYMSYLLVLVSMVSQEVNQLSVSDAAKQFTNWLQMVCHCLRDRVYLTPKTKHQQVSEWVSTRQTALRFLRRYRRTGKVAYLAGYLLNKTRFKEQRKEEGRKRREQKESEVKALLKERDWREIWRRIRRYISPGQKVASGIGADEWREYFKKLYNVPLEGRPTRNIDLSESPSIEALDGDITTNEVRTTLRKMKMNKAPGVDGVPTDVFKKLGTWIAEPLAKLYNAIYKSGTFPESWSLSVIQPIYKNKGSRKDPNMYRGIALLNSIQDLHYDPK